MSASCTLSSSSTQTPLPNPISDLLPGGDGSEDQAAIWKRRYHTLAEEVNAQKTSKRKMGSVSLIDIHNPHTERMDHQECHLY